MASETISILKAVRTASTEPMLWAAIEGGESVSVLDATGIEKMDDVLGEMLHYLVVRIPWRGILPSGCRALLSGRHYFVSEVRTGVRIQEVELLCLTLGDYVTSEVRRISMRRPPATRQVTVQSTPLDQDLLSFMAAALGV